MQAAIMQGPSSEEEARLEHSWLGSQLGHQIILPGVHVEQVQVGLVAVQEDAGHLVELPC